MAGKHTIRIRRGLKSELDLVTLAEGELGYTTDTKEVWIGGNSENILCGRAIVDVRANRPPSGHKGRVFECIDEKVTYIDTGSYWRVIGVANIDGLADGAIYGKVRLSELSDGKVKKVIAETTDSIVTGDEIHEHIEDDTKHRIIDDLLAGSTNLWSAGKIQNEIHNKLSGISWQEPVCVPQMVSDVDQEGYAPVDPEFGDAYVVNNWGTGYTDGEIREFDGETWNIMSTLDYYPRVIVKASGTSGSFENQENSIAYLADDGTWNFLPPEEGWALLIAQDYGETDGVYEHNGYTFTDGSWIQFTGLGQIQVGEGLSKSGNIISFLPGAGLGHYGVEENISVVVLDNQGLRLTSKAPGGGLAVDYDDFSLGIVNKKLAIKPSGVGPSEISSSAIGGGLTGGSGNQIIVNAGLGIQISNNKIITKVRYDGGLLIDTEGLKINPDGTGLVVSDNVLQMEKIDGGPFVEEQVTWYPAWSTPQNYWTTATNAAWQDTYFYNAELSNFVIRAAGSWNINFRPTKVRITFSGGIIDSVIFRDYNSNSFQSFNNINSGQVLDFMALSKDFWDIFIGTIYPIRIYNIEFDKEPPVPL